MAVNFYGSCSGSSGKKYDIWINVKQNSQSIEDNKTNITAKLILKRNDGYASSAYNLNESSNKVVLKIGGKEKVNKNLSIDTRNNVTVTLATWTGDVSHSDDGTLSLSVSGSFTMGGTSLDGGSVSGTFECTDIPRASVLTLSKTKINPLGTVGATIESKSSSFTHKIKWSLGGSSVTHTLSAGVTADALTVPASWAEEITESKSGTISVGLSTYKGSKKIGSKSYSLKLSIPEEDEYLPEFSLVVQRIDNSVPSGFGEYVKGKSQVKLNIEKLKLKYGAEAVSYTAKVGSSSKSKLPATFDLTKAGEITVSVSVKDSRGFTVKKSTTINVRKYSVPSVTVNSLSRCDENGNKTTTGTKILADFSCAYSSVNNKNVPKITYKYKSANSTVFSNEYELTGSPCILPQGDFLNNTSYSIAFRITDSITGNTDFLEKSVSSSAIPFNIRKGGNGASFGCYSEKDNELTVGWDLNVKGSLFYERVEPQLYSSVTNKKGNVRFFPCLEMVAVKLRFTANQALSSGSSHVIATMDKFPTLFTPLTVLINDGTQKIGQGGIRSETGELVVCCNKDIAAGDYIYVSGVYSAYRN